MKLIEGFSINYAGKIRSKIRASLIYLIYDEILYFKFSSQVLLALAICY